MFFRRHLFCKSTFRPIMLLTFPWDTKYIDGNDEKKNSEGNDNRPNMSAIFKNLQKIIYLDFVL